MTTRILPRAEWGRLADTDAGVLVPALTDSARVVVVEDGDRLVGCHVLQPVLHAEGLWIHPDYRGKTSVARRLWTAVQSTVATDFRVGHFVTGCASDVVERLLAHVGATKLPDHYVVPVEK